MLGQQAENGVTRREMLSRIGDNNAFIELVNQVYGFSGVITKQEMARKQFEMCMHYITKRK